MADQGAGLRGLVGAGRSRVSLSAAMRVRDSGRPDPAEIAAAEAEIDRRLAARPAVVASRRGPSPTAPRPAGTHATSRAEGRATPTPGDAAARGPHGSGGSSPSAS